MEEFKLDAFDSFAKIMVIGVGGGGNNAVNQMVEEGLGNIDFWVFNTDAQALAGSKATHKMVLGKNVTKGLGAGGDPEVGRTAAEDSIEDIKEIVANANMVFVAAGMGGGTGTGAAPVVAKVAKESGALVVAIVTSPFTFEGKSRKSKAVEGINQLKQNVDAYIIVSNDKLMFMNGQRPLSDAFSESDKVLAQSVKTITDLILLPGVINLDFADVRNTLKDKGLALIGFGMGKGERKAEDAATSAISSPLLEASIKGAHSAIINVTGGQGVTLEEAQEAVNYITEAAGSDVNIIFGVQQNPQLNDEMIISVIATEFDEEFDYENAKPILQYGSRVKNNESVENNGIDVTKEEVKEQPCAAPEAKEDKSKNDIIPNFLKNILGKNKNEEK